jgi:hypothetical protein
VVVEEQHIRVVAEILTLKERVALVDQQSQARQLP